MEMTANSRQWVGISLLTSIVALPVGCLVSGYASAEGETGTAPGASAPPATRHHARPALEDRVRMLSRTLDLDETQQSALRKVLESQRDQVMKVWSDSSVPAGYRVIATEAIADKTADQIRALLNEEQRKKYNQPRKPRDASAGAAQPNVEDWMKATQPK